MVKDYARSRTQAKRAPRRRALLTCLIIAIAAALTIPPLMLYNRHHHATHAPQKTTPNKPTVIQHTQQYDFYTLLPQMDVPNSKKEPNKP